jgi:protein-tyrosine-phosphatase
MPEPMHVLFICTGNTCRSPIAEALARRFAAERQLSEITVGSAGTAAWDGAPASDGALLVAMERSVDLSTHRARLLTRELVNSADLILAMGPHHLERIEALGGAGKTHLLSSYASKGRSDRSITDPFGGDLDVYRSAFDELDREVQQAIERIAAERAPGRP